MKLYLARVDTNYTTYAIADSEGKARQLALKSANKFLKQRGVNYKSLAEIEDALGCNIWELPLNGAIQEY